MADPEPQPPQQPSADDENARDWQNYYRAYHLWQQREAAWRQRHQPPGPQKKQPVDSSKGKNDLSGYTAGAIAEAQQLVNDFGDFIGWPTWFDANAFEKRLLEQGYQNDTTAAYEFMWSLLSASQQKANPNAYFGLTKQQYTEKLNNLTDMFENLTGMGAVPEDIKNKALRENWTQSELQDALQHNEGVMTEAPWLAVGQTYRDVLSRFGNTYGHAPIGTAQLGSWWKFTTGAQQVGTSSGAQITAIQPAPLVSRQLVADTEAR